MLTWSLLVLLQVRNQQLLTHPDVRSSNNDISIHTLQLSFQYYVIHGVFQSNLYMIEGMGTALKENMENKGEKMTKFLV